MEKEMSMREVAIKFNRILNEQFAIQIGENAVLSTVDAKTGKVIETYEVGSKYQKGGDDMESLTLQDCLDKYYKNQTVLINDGKIVGFENEYSPSKPCKQKGAKQKRFVQYFYAYFSLKRGDCQMEKEHITEVLNDIVHAVTILEKHQDYLCNTSIKEVHFHKCIREMASVMGLEIAEKPWKCEGWIATEISFEYRGVRFFELENYRKDDEDAGAD